MTLRRPVRLVAAFLVLGLTAALLAAVTPSPAVAGRGHHGHHGHARTRQGKKGKVVWDSTTFYAGSGAVAAHGRVPGGKKKVKLQVKLPGSWHTFASTKSNKKGKFAIAGALNWYGTHKVRVSTSGRHALQPEHQGQRVLHLHAARQPGRPRLPELQGHPLLLRPVQDRPLRGERRRRGARPAS